jgi:4-hydroxybenzoate polyprenyltransferase
MIKALIRALRPHQWVKNVILFAALVFDRQLMNWQGFLHTVLAVITFCAISSSVYLMNDLLDIESDRQHPKKKNRPIASGKLPIPVAIGASSFLGIGSLISAYIISRSFFFVVLTYLLIQIAYSTFLKTQPIIDVMVLASGFLLRVGAGTTIIAVERFSPWLYMCTGLLALFIGFGKRRAEMTVLEENAGDHRVALRGYTIPLLDKLITIVSTSTLMAYSLYTISAPNISDNHAMLITVIFVIFGLFRYQYLLEVKEAGGAPVEVLMEDRPLQIDVLLWGLSVLVIFYFLP